MYVILLFFQTFFYKFMLSELWVKGCRRDYRSRAERLGQLGSDWGVCKIPNHVI